MKKSVKITSPITITLPRKTKKDRICRLNLNQYRNRHYLISNKIKHLYCEEMKKQLDWLKFKSINITYQIYYPDKRKRDKWNYYSIVQKFFLDSLVHRKCIKDDNDSIVWDETFKKPIYDKWKGRVEITTTEVDE